jgi:hypothetical protein
MTPPLLYCEHPPRFTAVAVVARCVGFAQRLPATRALASWPWSWWIHEAGVPAGNVQVLCASCWDYLIHAGCKRHITPQGVVATGPVKFVGAGASRGCHRGRTGDLEAASSQVEDWTACTYACICGGNSDGAVGCWS